MDKYESIATELDNLAREVRQLRERYRSLDRLVCRQHQILSLCPGGLPDGTGTVGPEQWILWARKKLGYSDFDGLQEGLDKTSDTQERENPLWPPPIRP